MKIATIVLASAVLLTLGAGPAWSQNLLTNPGIQFLGINGAGDDAVPDGWEMNESIVQTAENGFETLAEGAFYGHRRYQGDGCYDIGRCWNMWFKPYVGTFTQDIAGVPNAEDNFAHLYQDVAGSPGMQYTMTGFAAAEAHFSGGVSNLNWQTGDPGSPSPDPNNFTDGPLSPTDVFFALEFLDASDIVINTHELELFQAGLVNSSVANWTDAVWKQFTIVAVAPAGTTQVRVRASMMDGVVNPGADPQSFFVDGFSLTAEEVTGTPGNFDLDGDVDGRDFLVWQRGGSPSPYSAIDLQAWQGAYGAPLVAIRAVPEPSTAVAISLMSFGFLAIRRRS